MPVVPKSKPNEAKRTQPVNLHDFIGWRFNEPAEFGPIREPSLHGLHERIGIKCALVRDVFERLAEHLALADASQNGKASRSRRL